MLAQQVLHALFIDLTVDAARVAIILDDDAHSLTRILPYRI
jgi:hypothetical protein